MIEFPPVGKVNSHTRLILTRITKAGFETANEDASKRGLLLLASKSQLAGASADPRADAARTVELAGSVIGVGRSLSYMAQCVDGTIRQTSGMQFRRTIWVNGAVERHPTGLAGREALTVQSAIPYLHGIMIRVRLHCFAFIGVLMTDDGDRPCSIERFSLSGMCPYGREKQNNHGKRK